MRVFFAVGCSMLVACGGRSAPPTLAPSPASSASATPGSASAEPTAPATEAAPTAFRLIQVDGVDGARDDSFGFSIDVSGDTALIGAPGRTVAGRARQGSAFVFRRSGPRWKQQEELCARDGSAGDSFGTAVALHDDLAVVAAPRRLVGVNEYQGAVYAFARQGQTWAQVGPPLAAADGAPRDFFGQFVALSGERALVGVMEHGGPGREAQGAAYVFARRGGAFSADGPPLVAPDAHAYDRFGSSVALSGDTALVGASERTVASMPRRGAAYVFTRGSAAWTPTAMLTASNGAAEDDFGLAVALGPDRALVAAPYHDVDDHRDAGAVYYFVREGDTWHERDMLTAPNGQALDAFGLGLALDGDRMFVGAMGRRGPHGRDAGAVYAFVLRDGRWRSSGPELVAPEPRYRNSFGWAVALSGRVALVGEPNRPVGDHFLQGAVFATWLE